MMIQTPGNVLSVDLCRLSLTERRLIIAGSFVRIVAQSWKVGEVNEMRQMPIPAGAERGRRLS